MEQNRDDNRRLERKFMIRILAVAVQDQAAMTLASQSVTWCTLLFRKKHSTIRASETCLADNENPLEN